MILCHTVSACSKYKDNENLHDLSSQLRACEGRDSFICCGYILVYRYTQDTQISLNKQKLGEPSVYLKPVEQTLYSATVPIKKSVDIFQYTGTRAPAHVGGMQ